MGAGDVRYTAGDPAIAYEVVGDGGGIDVLTIAPILTHLEISWEEPRLAAATSRLAGLGRIIRFDRRGCGMSDPATGAWTLADEVDDVIAVLDAAGAAQVAVVGWLAGGSLACLVAAAHPDRVRSLVLDTCSPRQTHDVDYTWAPTRAERDRFMGEIGQIYGTGERLARFAPTWAALPGARAWMARLERMTAGPGATRRLFVQLGDIDVRGVLPSIRAPTLVVRRRGDARIDRRHSLHAAEHIPNARLVETDGTDSMPWGDHADEWMDLVGEFIAGTAPPPLATRGLATLLFTDIVDSTATLERVGDTAWRTLLERHDAAATAAVGANGGRIVKLLGDGVFARFDAVPDAVAAAQRLLADTAGLGVDVRAGVHLGDCELVGEDLAGRTVHEAARIAALAGPGELLVSDAAHGLLPGAGIATTDRGRHVLKGFSGTTRLWAVTAA